MTILGSLRYLRSTGRPAAGRPVEEHPDGEARREVLEPVRLAGRDEQERAGSDRVAVSAVEEAAGSGRRAQQPPVEPAEVERFPARVPRVGVGERRAHGPRLVTE